MDKSSLVELVSRYKGDAESVYNTWFISGAERMKAFRSIRRGVKDVIESIASGTFPNDFKGSPLETVLTAITEQKQVFEGAAHPFYWKPKMRIPDIYECPANKQKFGVFLHNCMNATGEEQILAEISRLDAAKIKGLGPAVANILYFLHPTIVPPFNTAMLNGFNALFSDKKKLGSWQSYLDMREVIVRTNNELRDSLSKDLGAIAGLLFEIGSGRLLISGNLDAVMQEEKAKAEKAARQRHADVMAEAKEESEHTQMQALLIRLGRALGYDVHVARNDRGRSYDGQPFALMTLAELPSIGCAPEVMDTITLIDVIWLRKGTAEVVSAFEVERSTSIYSGILRLEDLARSIPGQKNTFYLVAPQKRENEVLAQLARPAFREDLRHIPLAFIPFDELAQNCDALCRFGQDHHILEKICRCSPPQQPQGTVASL